MAGAIYALLDLMSMHGPYHILKAETAEAKACHQALIAEAHHWPPMLLADLESCMHAMLDETPEEVERIHKKKKKSGTGEGDETGDGSGSGDGHGVAKVPPVESEDLIDIDPLEHHALLVYKGLPSHLAEPLAARMMLLNRAAKTAQVTQPFTTEDLAKQAGSGAQYVGAFERHAAQTGANVMYVRIHPSAMGLFKRELGYEAVGAVTIENGMQIQAMRKVIGFKPALPGDVPC
jgi:hypothetical protein